MARKLKPPAPPPEPEAAKPRAKGNRRGTKNRSREPRPVGRPPECTPEVTVRICDLLRENVSRNKAATLAGINPSTFYRWMLAGETGDDPLYIEFRNHILRAEAELQREAALVLKNGLVDENANIRQRAAIFTLTHRFGEDYSPKARVEATGADGGPVQLAVAGQLEVRGQWTLERLAQLPDDELDRLIEQKEGDEGGGE